MLKVHINTQKMKFSIKDFFSKCDQILKKSLMKNFIFCAVHATISWSGRWTDQLILNSFISTFLNSPGCNCILSGKFWSKTLFRNLFDRFSVLSYINSIILLLTAFIIKCLLYIPTLIEIIIFFINLFMKQNHVFHGKKYLRYNEFLLLPSNLKLIMIFLAPYDAGKKMFEEQTEQNC